MYRLSRGVRGVIALMLSVVCCAQLGAQDGPRIDYRSQIQPIFTESCAGGFCHVDMSTSGIDLTDYPSLVGSQGRQYENLIVPGDPDASSLIEKIVEDEPQFGGRMPRSGKFLSDPQVDAIRRWILEGALEFPETYRRGDVEINGKLNITDGIYILRFLFLGSEAPYCLPIADINHDAALNLSDAVFLLNYLFIGGPVLEPLTRDEQAECNGTREPPVVAPIGTVLAREGIELTFSVQAEDPAGQTLEYSVTRGPDGFAVDPATGVVTWTPGFGSAGDHRVGIEVSVVGDALLSTETTGLVRVEEGNRPPRILTVGPFYGREGVPLDFVCEAADDDGDMLLYQLVDAPMESGLDGESGAFSWTPQIGEAGTTTIRIRVTDDGDPPQIVEVGFDLIIADADSPENQAPRIAERGVYRGYVGRSVSFALDVSDPDGDDLDLEVENLPTGATLSPEGNFAWTPTAEQTGPFYVTVTARDQGLPPLEAQSILLFRILPDEPCGEVTCDPSTGCTHEVPPIAEACCSGPESTLRVAEPVVFDCPEARVLYVGRNTRGFGRLQNCDFLPIIPLGQGGSIFRFHIETRCIDTVDAVSVTARMETASNVVFDSTRAVFLNPRQDGFAQRLSIAFSSPPDVTPVLLDGQEALMTIRVEDQESSVTTQLRLRLTLDAVPDLPDPDIADLPSGEAGCVGCHRPVGRDGQRHGIEEAHPWAELSCTDCHGGSASSTTREFAHVSPGAAPSFIKQLTSDELDEVNENYIRFINPGDLRVAHIGCGSSSPANPGGGCHQSVVDKTQLSVMNTFVGHYKLPRYLAGTQDREATLGAIDVVDPNFDPETAPEGAVGELQALRDVPFDADRSDLGVCIDVYLPKSCPTCHLSDFGPNDDPGKFRSSGCTACHMNYKDDGLSRSLDAMISKDFPPHPAEHRLTSSIGVEQCSHCHFQGGRIGLAYRGIREGGFSPDKTPANAVPLDKEIYGHEAGYYFLDEDDTNDYDETPPDLHFEAGMVCADCHVGGDVHGDGNLYTGERFQVGIRCEDCHGTVRESIAEDVNDGFFKNSKGDSLKRVRRTEDDRIVLERLEDKVEIEVPQIARLLASGQNAAMEEAMGVNEHGFSHSDKMECYTCHTSWRQTCFGCHLSLDDRGSTKNFTTGRRTLGVFQASRQDYSTDFFALGINRRGLISPLCSSMSVFMSYTDSKGFEHYNSRIRTSSGGKKGFGWNPFHHHTVSRVPQNCDRCHSVADGNNVDLLLETYGFGNGKILATDDEGVEHDLTQFLDEDGNLISDFPHPNTGPVPADVRERAMSIEVVPHPRQER